MDFAALCCFHIKSRQKCGKNSYAQQIGNGIVLSDFQRIKNAPAGYGGKQRGNERIVCFPFLFGHLIWSEQNRETGFLYFICGISGGIKRY